MNDIPREKIYEDVYILLKTIFHYERIGAIELGLKIEEVYTLHFLRQNQNSRVTELSKELQLPMFTVSRMVDRLAKKQFLSKEQDPADHRNYFLHISPKGEEILKRVESFSFDRISTNLANMDQTQVEELLHLASQLHLVLGVTKEVFH